MKRTTILNRELSYLIASLGHLDEIVVADAGLQIPDGVAVIDLAVMAGVPSLFDVLHALSNELVIETMITVAEKSETLEKLLEAERFHWEAEQGKDIAFESLQFDAFKIRCENARAVIRTGTVKPFTSVVLVSGFPY